MNSVAGLCEAGEAEVTDLGYSRVPLSDNDKR